MLKVPFMASHGGPNWLDFHKKRGVCRVIQVCQPILPNHGLGHELIKPDSCNLRELHYVEPMNRLSWLSESIKFVKIDSIVPRPILVDIQDTDPNSLLLGLGIAKECTRQEKMLQLLISGSSEVEKGIDLCSLSDLIEVQALMTDTHRLLLTPYEYGSSLHYPTREMHVQKPLWDFIGDLARDSKSIAHPDGQISLTGPGAHMKDLLMVVAEFYSSKNLTQSRKQTVVPYFNRPKSREARAASSLNLKTGEFAPSKSAENVKHKQSSKNSINRAVKERDIYRKNSFRACETLLSLMMEEGQNRMTSLLLIRKSGPELPELLTQFAADIAGTGIAVLFLGLFKMGYGKIIPLCVTKELNLSVGFGLVWLSLAVNRLRDTVLSISKSSIKFDSKEDEMIRTLDRSVDEIFFRIATVLALVVMRFARV